MRSALALALGLALAACGAESEGPSASVLADLGVLHALIDADPASEPLELVDRRIDDERPVHAAELLAATAIPAAERQVATLRDARVATDEGRRFARRLTTAYQARVDALHAYRVVLEGGASADPVALLDGLRGVRQAQEQLLAIVQEMNALTPGPEAPPGGPAVDEEEPAE